MEAMEPMNPNTHPQNRTQNEVAEKRQAREEATAHKTRHLELAGKPLSEAADAAERVEIKLARLGRALEASCFARNDMHLLGMVRDALDDDDDDPIDQPAPPEPVTQPARPARRRVRG